MKIGNTTSVSRAGRVRGQVRNPAAGAATSVSPPRPIADTTSVMGIPETELTPKVQAAIQTLMEEVDRLRQSLDQATQRLAGLEQLADQDPLMPIANRRAFVRELSRIQSFSERYDSPASLVFFDLNGFKDLNDTHGHVAGDAALRHVAQTLIRNLRESDVVGRLGGDEFGVILVQAEEATAKEKARTLAEAIRTTPFEWQGATLNLDVAYGIYAFGPGDQALDVDEALARADSAMYAQKNAMKSRAG